jgi:E3 ubiquitin-protein ligase SHPRH
LREAKLILHKIKFLMGDLFHNLEMSKDEDEAYEHAERLRKDLLQGSEEDASRAMAQLDEDLTKKRFNARELEIRLPYLGKGGIRSAEFVRLFLIVYQHHSHPLCRWKKPMNSYKTSSTNKPSSSSNGVLRSSSFSPKS